MTFEEFNAAGQSEVRGALLALWLDRRDHWDRAHEVAQALPGREGAWVHAYLHRKEDDLANAGYWYRRAGQPVATGALTAEWEAMVRTLLGES